MLLMESSKNVKTLYNRDLKQKQLPTPCLVTFELTPRVAQELLIAYLVPIPHVAAFTTSRRLGQKNTSAAYLTQAS